MTGCERIKRTSMPYNYIANLRIFMVTWMLTYPVFVVGTIGWIGAPPVCIFIAFMFLKLEQMATELSDPFGLDSYDLDLDQICKRIEQNLHAIMQRAEGHEVTVHRASMCAWQTTVAATPLAPGVSALVVDSSALAAESSACATPPSSSVPSAEVPSSIPEYPQIAMGPRAHTTGTLSS